MSEKLLEVFDRNRKRIAVLNNAFQITETEKLNDISALTFQLPDADEKKKHLAHRNFVRFAGGELYRILDEDEAKESVGVLEYQCEHAAATLADTIMFRDHILEGRRTPDVIRYVLGFQSNWVLHECDFNFEYGYTWNGENLIGALLSIPMPFTDAYRFVFDTHVYPWRLSLKRLDRNGKPSFYIFDGLNFLRSHRTKKSSTVYTRLYCLGFGEGVNQLGIEKVNPTGKPYVDASAAAIAKYGIIEGQLLDRKYDSAQELFDVGKAAIQKLQEPREEYEVDAADLEGISSNAYMKARAGGIILSKEDGYKTFILEVARTHDEAGSMSLKLANTPDDIVKSIADIAERQRIEATYAQGATQIWGSVLQGNATPTEPLVFPLWIPASTRVVNEVQVKIKLSKFRADSKTTRSGGGSAQTSGASGGGTVTSEAGGDLVLTNPQRTIPISTYTSLPYINGAAGHYRAPNTDYATPTSGNLRHRHPFDHDHLFTTSILIPSIIINLPSHRHNVSRGNHQHSVTFHDHSHELEFGIFYGPETPTAATVKVNGKAAFSMGADFEGDITQYMLNDNGEFPRGVFLDIAVTPNTNAHVSIAVSPRAFIQSREGGVY